MWPPFIFAMIGAVAGAAVDDKQTMLGTVIVAICTAIPPTLMAWAALRQSRANSVKSDVDHKAVVSEVKEKTDELKQIVNGPLGVALAAAAKATTELAARTGDPAKIKEAAEARQASEEHEALVRAANMMKQKTEEEKQAIIADYLVRQGLPPQTQEKLKDLYKEL